MMALAALLPLALCPSGSATITVAQQAEAPADGAQASTGGNDGAKPADDDVVDADFKEVKDK